MRWDPALYDAKHGFVHKFGEALLDLLEITPGLRVLDVGCGTGHLTKQIADRGAVAVGIDNAVDMIDQARAAYPGVHFVAADASDFSVQTPFDAVFSNAALHWVTRADDAARCMSAALRPGGRLVIEMGGTGNVATLVGALREAVREVSGAELALPWYFPSLGEYAALLEKHGVEVVAAWLFDRPTPLAGEDGLRHWCTMFAGSLLKSLSDADRARAIDLACARLRPALFRGDAWTADYRRLRMVAIKRSDAKRSNHV